MCWKNDVLWDGEKWWTVDDSQWDDKHPDEVNRNHRLNSYRVLLTRGRDGIIIYIPNKSQFKDTYAFFKNLGIQDLETANGL